MLIDVTTGTEIMQMQVDATLVRQSSAVESNPIAFVALTVILLPPNAPSHYFLAVPLKISKLNPCDTKEGVDSTLLPLLATTMEFR